MKRKFFLLNLFVLKMKEVLLVVTELDLDTTELPATVKKTVGHHFNVSFSISSHGFVSLSHLFQDCKVR